MESFKFFCFSRYGFLDSGFGILEKFMRSNEVPGDISVSLFTGRRNLVGFTPLLSMHTERDRETERTGKCQN